MVRFLTTYGYGLVFGVVLTENLGLPLPSFVVVLLAATRAGGRVSLAGLIFVSVIATLTGDLVWYVLGRMRGRPILRILCSISLNPDSCVSRTENLFARHGLKSLLIAKFVPGLNSVAPPLAGMLKVSSLRFVVYDLAGSVLWAGSAVLAGHLFRAQVEWLLAWLGAIGKISGLVLVVLLAGWVLLKVVERRRFYRLLERSRISVPEVKEMLDRGEQIVLVDLRSDLSFQTDGLKARGAIHIPPHEFEFRYREIPSGRTVVMYCT